MLTRVVAASSELDGCVASNCLSEALEELWLSAPGMPQWVTLELTCHAHEENELSFFSWTCWHCYTTNPRCLELWTSASGMDGTFMRHGNTIVAEAAAGQQLHLVQPPIRVGGSRKTCLYVRVVVVETFGGDKVYINRLQLLTRGEVQQQQQYAAHEAYADVAMKSQWAKGQAARRNSSGGVHFG